MRINYCDDEDRPGQFALWDANCQRSLRGRAGQAALRDLEAALLALPQKRLIRGLLVSDDGADVCAVGAYARYKGEDIAKHVPYASDDVAIACGMPRLVAWKVVALNDFEIDDHYVTGQRVTYTPEERYIKVLAWVREQLKTKRLR